MHVWTVTYLASPLLPSPCLLLITCTHHHMHTPLHAHTITCTHHHMHTPSHALTVWKTRNSISSLPGVGITLSIQSTPFTGYKKTSHHSRHGNRGSTHLEHRGLHDMTIWLHSQTSAAAITSSTQYVATRVHHRGDPISTMEATQGRHWS